MKGFLAGLLMLTTMGLSPVFAKAEPWPGEGWYQVEYTEDLVSSHGGKGLHAGPFNDKETCLATIPPEDNDGGIRTTYECLYLEDWSEL